MPAVVAARVLERVGEIGGPPSSTLMAPLCTLAEECTGSLTSFERVSVGLFGAQCLVLALLGLLVSGVPCTAEEMFLYCLSAVAELGMSHSVSSRVVSP